MKSIVRVELNERRMREWVAEARPMLKLAGQSLRTYRRVLSASGVSVPIWVAVLDHGTAKP